MPNLLAADAGLSIASAALLFGLGMLLAGVYFAGLWWTVRTIAHVRHPWLLYVGSTAIRLVVLMGVLFGLMAGDWRRGVLCLTGFVIGRLVVVYRFGLSELSDAALPTSRAADTSAAPESGGLSNE